jgi:NitT/TauT family transport system substrate-binding protein
MKKWHFSLCAGALLMAVALAGSLREAAAEAAEVRIAGVYGLINLPVYVAMEKHFVEKQANAAGLPDVKVSFMVVSGGANAADLILSNNVDVAAVGITNMMVLWDKTRTLKKRAVRGMMALCDSPVFLITTDPRIKSLRDFKDTDRIAVTSIKTSVQAIVLGIASAKEFGWDQRFKLDPLTVAMPHADGMAAILSGSSEVKSQAAQLPFSLMEMESGKAHLILNSTEALGGPANIGVAITTYGFRQGNPKLYAAVQAGLQDSIDYINNNMRDAAEIYVKYEPQKNGVDWIYNIVKNPELISFSSMPHGTETIGDYIFKVGMLRNQPKSWKDFYWDEAQARPGN